MSAEFTVERPERRPHEYYSHERKAEILSLLDANDGNVWRTAQESNIPHSLLQYWIANESRYANLRQEKKTDLVDKLDFHINLALDTAQKRAEEATYGQLMTGAAIAIDKKQLLLNQPTNIVQHVNSESLTVVLQQVLNEITTSTEPE